MILSPALCRLMTYVPKLALFTNKIINKDLQLEGFVASCLSYFVVCCVVYYSKYCSVLFFQAMTVIISHTCVQILLDLTGDMVL